MTFAITDTALRKIAGTVGQRVPESGGALMGPAGADLVTDFIFDPQASVTGASYVPSDWLQKAVNQAESSEGTLTLKGILHSHPGGMNKPSSTDLESFETYLQANSGLEEFAAIICTFVSGGRHGSSALQSHELMAADGVLRYSFFRASATGNRSARLRTDRPRVVSVGAFLGSLVDSLGPDWAYSQPVATTIDGVGGLLAEVQLCGRTEALFFLSGSFPVAPPTATFGSALSGGEGFHGLPWDLSQTFQERVTAVSEAINGRLHSRPRVDRASPEVTQQDPANAESPTASAVDQSSVQSLDIARHSVDRSPASKRNSFRSPGLGFWEWSLVCLVLLVIAVALAVGTWKWGPWWMLLSVPGLGAVVALLRLLRRRHRRKAVSRLRVETRHTESLLSRSAGFLDSHIARESVVVLGCGSVGSTAAVMLARSGVGSFTLIDPEQVEKHNIGRSVYGRRDSGKPKVRSLKRIIREINPGSNVHLIREDFRDIPDVRVREILNGATIVFGAADDHQAMARLSRYSYSLGVPAVFVGVYAKARGGEIIISAPPLVCYECAVHARAMLDESGAGLGSPTQDYGTGRLVAEPGLYTDVAVLSTYAVKLLLAFTRSLPENSSLRDDFFEPLQSSRQTFGLFGLSPEFAFFSDPSILGNVPSQLAFQSVWVEPTRIEDCSTCGTLRTTPKDFVTPNLDELRHAVATADEG